MEPSVLTLNGLNLTLSDLVKVLKGAAVKVDPEVLLTLVPSAAIMQNVEPHCSQAYLTIILNVLLRSPALVAPEIVNNLLALISAKSTETVQVTEYAEKLFAQESYKVCSELIQTVHNLLIVIPLLDGLIGINIEAGNIDSSVADEELYANCPHGVKSTISNLQSLLHDSKLAKKNPPSENLIELIQLSGVLKDLIECCEKTIEKEANASISNLKATCIPRSTGVLVKSFSELLSVSIGIASLISCEIPVINFAPSFRKFSDLLNAFQVFQCFTTDLIIAVTNSLKKGLVQLSDLEAKINQGANKHRPLQLGKGSRALYQYLKESSPSDSEISIFLSTLLTAKNEERRVPKIAKGMRDYASEEMRIRDHVFSVIRTVFKKHMADELDTPVMELRETLTGKYGEEGSKLIYNVDDQGGELLSLRYDLTVPLARYVSMNRITNWKRFQIGKVYRRDQPQLKKGRYREFYQCDFDIIGVGSVMSQDAEVLKILSEILCQLDFNFVIKINHRKLLDSFLDISGVPSEKYRTVSSSIDKLDKEEWGKVRNELVNEKGISEECADLIGQYVKLNGQPSEVLAKLMSFEILRNHEVANKALQELSNLLNYCECLNILQYLNLDMSLARGLDYYTGLVYEAVIIDGTTGSIAGGGRYDELIMKLNNSNQPVPAVGVSLGVERLFTIMEERYKALKANSESSTSIEHLLKSKVNTVLVAQAGNSQRFNLIQERYKLCNALWDKGINAETSYKEKSDPKGQAGYASQQGIKWVVWIGESELVDGKVKVKDLISHNEELISVDSVVDFILSH